MIYMIYLYVMYLLLLIYAFCACLSMRFIKKNHKMACSHTILVQYFRFQYILHMRLFTEFIIPKKV